MEDNLLCPSYKCNVMELLPILLDINSDEEIVISPSQLNYELQMSTEERLTRLCKPTRKHRISTEINTFSRTPDIIIFQNFTPGMVYKTTISFLNIHPVSRHLRLVTRNSLYFEVVGPKEDCSAKLAPGMSYTLNVTFLPMEDRNYIYHITIMTDTESFTVPIYGLGAMALLNLPDEIKLPPTAINISSKKKFILHNFGKAPASFVITSRDPFHVSPYRELLLPGQFMDIKVTCKAPTIGHMKENIILFYNNIKLTIPVECEVNNVNIHLDRDSILFDEIYIGLKRQDSVALFNSSNHIIKFKWKLHKSAEIDQLENSKMVKNLEGIREIEKKRCTKLEMMNVIDYEGHSNIYDQIFEDEVAKLEDKNIYLFQNLAFEIVPLTGQIYPNTSQMFNIVFSPKKKQFYESCAYLDVTGNIERLPLKLSGKSKGPYVSLNVKVLNISDVFLCATHYYEIIVKNQGNIPATVVFKNCITDFNSIINCVPKKVYLAHQDCCSAFLVSFYSECKGKFIETVEFVVKESDELLQFVMTGNVVCPLLKMDVRGIDFDNFPFGVQQLRNFLLINDCQVPIEYKIVLLKNSVAPQGEIEFDPDCGVVDAYSNQSISVQLNSGRSKEQIVDFKVIMWGTEQYSISSFIKYNCVCPKIKCSPSNVKIKFCFLNYEYRRTIVLKNEASVSGMISYNPEIEFEGNIICTLSKTEFEIDAYGSEEIELSIITNVLGVSELPLMFTVAGAEPCELCKITIDGQGPVVSYRPEEINFGRINLLEDVKADFVLINDSPISATVQISKAHDTFFELDIDQMEILPDEEKIITLSALLTDTGKYTGTVTIDVHHGESIDIKVFGEGVGHSVQCEPLIGPEYDAGVLLTYQPFVLPLKLINLGKRLYKVRWTTFPILKSLKDKLDFVEPGYVFQIKPQYIEVSYLETKIVEVQGFAKSQRQVEEEFYCFAMTDKSNKLSFVMSFKMKAKFVEPAVSIKKPVLDLLVARDDCLVLEDVMTIVSEINIPMTLNFSTNNDYFIVDNNQDTKFISHRIEGQGKLDVHVKFAPGVHEKRYFICTGELAVGFANHPISMKFELKSEVCYPTVKLSQSELKFSCIPLNSYAYKTFIIQNITFLPVQYSWEVLEEFFEMEDLPKEKEQQSSPRQSTSLDLEDVPSDVRAMVLTGNQEEMNNKYEEKAKDEKREESIVLIKHDSSKITWSNAKYMKEMKKILFPTIEKFIKESDSAELLDGVKTNLKSNGYQINNILSMEPFRGQLEPYEYGVITVGFFPLPNTRIRAKAICKIEGGEYETLSIVGLSCQISYDLDKKFVEFGCKLFCEICENTITVTNNGFCIFNFCVDDSLPDISSQQARLYVSPKCVRLTPGNSATLKIKYIPGKIGEFTDIFTMTIGYLEPFEIKVHGYAVSSQVYAYIPRPAISQLPSELLYQAVSVLSRHYLTSLAETYVQQPPPNKCVLDTTLDSMISRQLGPEWVVITKNDVYPSVIDIDLSVERLLLAQHLINEPGTLEEHSQKHKVKVIPNFVTPPYLLDFGYVVIEKPVCYTVLLLNYGPTVTDIKMAKETMGGLDKNKFTIEFEPKRLYVGDTAQLYVIFRPTLKKYPNPDITVRDHFSLTVSHGATIPIVMNVTVTLPRLTFEDENINFGDVSVGCCLRKCIIIRNNGHVLSKWSAEFKKKSYYFMKPNKGELPPGKRGMLEIYFMPTVKDFLQGKLYMYIEGNPKKISIDLYGQGVGPNLEFNHVNLDFKSSLPYTRDSSMTLTIKNTASIPMEFCFASFDRQYEQEKFWITTYFNSHNVKSVLVPQRKAGEALDSLFEDNYNMHIEELREKIIKSPDLELSQSSDDPLLKYTQDEIAKMISEIAETNQFLEDVGTTDARDSNDVFYSGLTVVEPKRNKLMSFKNLHSGVFIIFHGGLNTNYLQAAHRTGAQLKIPVYSIDRLIYESLTDNSIPSVKKINKLINDAFELVATREELDPVPEEDDYDLLMRKVYLILNNKMPVNKKGTSKDKGDKKNITAEKSSLKHHLKKEKESLIIADIPIEMIEDLLKFKLKTFSSGIIIESLHSDFFKKEIGALNVLLCSIGNVKFVQLIIMSYTLQNYINEELEKNTKVNMTTSTEVKASHQNSLAANKSETRTVSSGGKTSVKSKNPRNGPDDEKSVLKKLSKIDKDAFDTFQHFLNECFDLCQFWDKRNSVLLKSKPITIKMEDQRDSNQDRAVLTKKNVGIAEGLTEESGILLWIINNAHKKRLLDFPEIIITLLKEHSDLIVAMKDLDESMEEQYERSSVLFTVETKRSENTITKSDVFLIECLDDVEKKELEPVSNLKSTASLVSSVGSMHGKKRLLRQHKVSETQILDKGKHESQRKYLSRRILQPNEVAHYQFTFAPKKCGVYENIFEINVTGISLNHMLNCSAICELPMIDFHPNVLFPQVLESYRDKAPNTNFVYIKELNVFDFGLGFLDEKPNIYQCNLLLRNISRLPCEVKISLSDKSAYTLDSNLLSISPGQEVQFPISVKIVRPGLLQSNLCISVKNNPEAKLFKLVTKPCKLDLRIKPKLLVFDKVPINHSLKKKITLSNHSPINVNWKLVDYKWAQSIYKISKTEGSLGPFSVVDIFFLYAPVKEELHPKKQLEIHTFDPHLFGKKPLLVETLTLSSEAVEYHIEYCDHIDLGELKGKTEYKIPFTLLNKGHCNICLSFMKINNPLDKDKNIRKYFEIKNTSEVLYPNKLFTGTIIFKPMRTMEFKEVPIFVYNVVECPHQENVMNSYVIKVSAKVFLSSFEIWPASDINFGYQQTFSTKKHLIEMKNTGKFPFTYTILSLNPKREQSDTGKIDGTKKKADKSGKSKSKKSDKDKNSKKSKDSKQDDKKKKLQPAKLKLDCFSIASSSDEIMPKRVAQIEVECNPCENKEYREVIIIYVSEPLDEDVKGRQITLSVTGCEPVINFDDFRKIFREQFLTDKIENLQFPKSMESHCVYESSEGALHFRKVPLNTKSQSRIYLQNTGHVTAYVTAKIDDGNKNVFKVSPANLDIVAYSTKPLAVVFKPECVGESNGKLDITYSSSNSSKFSLALIGEGLIPKINLLEPSVIENNESTIDFDLTYMGTTRSQRISIQNVGLIFAKVILEICDNVKEIFTLKVCPDTIDMLNICDVEEFQHTKHATLVNLQPDQIANFDLIFQPDQELDTRVDIKIHTIGNPFEIVNISVNGQSYYHHIYVKGLTPCFQTASDVVGFNVDFGYSYLHTIKKKTFSMRNNSDIHTYKFEFINFGPITFIPKVGHLKPSALKEIVIIFSSKIPISYEKEFAECVLNRIKCSDPSQDLSWDERQKFLTFKDILEHADDSLVSLTKSSVDKEISALEEQTSENQLVKNVKRVEDQPEPEFEYIAGTSEIIPFFISVIADYATYLNDNLHEITFPDTNINENNLESFKIRNDGNVPLKIEWSFLSELVQLSTEAIKQKSEETDRYEDANELVKSSSTSLFSSNCRCSCMDEETFPFTVTPKKTSILPADYEKFVINFSPSNATKYSVKLQSNIACLKPKLKNIDIKIMATSLLPLYYFEIPESTYLSRKPDVVRKCGTVEFSKVNIIEFESVGTDVLCIRKFNLVNPTKDILSYKFHSLKEFPVFSYFDCKTTSGFVSKRKKAEIIFTFKAQEFGNFEEYFLCDILTKGINVPFLLAGKCRQPHVYFTKSFISIKPTILMIHSTTTAVIRNDENTELSFKFLKEFLLDEYQDQELEISPKSGKLRPNSEEIIKITFKAEKIGQVNFSLRCTVEKLLFPLSLNIFAECVEVSSSITYCDKIDSILISLDKDKENVIDFGTITPKKGESINFIISNTGSTGFFYNMQFNVKPISHMFSFSVNQDNGFVASNETSSLTIYLQAHRKAVLRNFKVKINISYGPTYLLHVNAIAEKPLVRFSFNTFDFGYCIVQKRKSTYYNVSLALQNVGTKVLLLENCYESSENLTVDFKCCKIHPSSSQHVVIYFHPLKVGRYEINIPFAVNSVKFVVKIKGEAVGIHLQLVNKNDKYIDFGATKIGETKQYAVQVINRTLSHVNVFFDLWQRLPFHSRPAEKLESDIKVPEVPELSENHLPSKKSVTGRKKDDKKGIKKDENKSNISITGRTTNKNSKSAVANSASVVKIQSRSKKKEKGKNANTKNKNKIQEQPEVVQVVQEEVVEIKEEPPKLKAEPKTALDFLKISPRDCTQLGPDKKHQFVIHFTPTEQINISEQIYYEIQDHIEPLCVIKGYSIAPNFSLSEISLTFSNVVIGLKYSMNILLKNDGDVRGRFQWVLERGMDVFTITPISGFVGVSTELEICVTFTPKKPDRISRTKVKCLIEGLDKSLELTLEGSSTKVPSPISTLYFTCPVRELTHNTIEINNTTKDQWKIQPILSNHYFTTDRDIIVEPGTEYFLEITYHPESMTTLSPHNATLFLPLPEGKAIVYELIGQALPPLPINKLKLDIKCKKSYTHTLPIRNWLNIKQCFVVTTELVTPSTPQCLYKSSGNPLIELFPNESKSYNWNIYVINDISLDFKVTFTNPETKEYMYYEISANVLPSGPLETINISTCVRKPEDFVITLENPIDYRVTFTIERYIPELIFDNVVTVDPYSTYKLNIQYLPLKSEQVSTSLNVSCPELGTFLYHLNLTAKPPLAENTVKFKAELGERVCKSVLWKNTFKAPIEFSAKFDHHVFSMEKMPPVLEGESGRIKFSFEPNNLGTLQSKGILYSPHTGNYIYPLIGECILPTPKGPFTVKPGGSALINFVNPFMEDQYFNYDIDSDLFYLKTNSEVIKAKKSTKIVVSMQPAKYFDSSFQSCRITTKLHVEPINGPVDVKWLFYIQSDI